MSNREEINSSRRSFFGGAAMTIAAAHFCMPGLAKAQSGEKSQSAGRRGASATFGPIKQIEAGVLNVGYAEAGPAGTTFPRRRPGSLPRRSLT